MSRGPSDAEYEQFVHTAWASLYRTAYLMLGDHAAAEDLVQTTLAKTYAGWRRVRDVQAAHGYARTTMFNTARSMFRSPGWRKELASERVPEQVYTEDTSTRSDLMDALRRLAPRQRAVVVLRFYEDLSVAQTADALGISEGTVKSQTSDAMDRLRALLGDAVLPQEGAVR
jgi:RNA polymerase sigma-70 factor (sigma-E family)